MKILFTGGSSFTGYWFVKELVANGHQVVAVFTQDASSYRGIRKSRVDDIINLCTTVFGVKFGDDAFLKLIKTESDYDVFCHHAAYIKDYKESTFDVCTALKENTNNVSQTIDLLKRIGCKNIILTGSYFENDEGIDNKGNSEAVSPYGLSKSLTYQVFKFHCLKNEIKLGKFVIPNPFGSLEDPRFTTYLISSWSKKMIPSVKTPEYFRDNIPVDLLAKTYSYFVNKLKYEDSVLQKINPSCYAEKQGAFTRRFATKMNKYLGVDTPFKLEVQTDFSEPLVRMNLDPVSDFFKDWDEETFWEQSAAFYNQQYF
jgi:UDP-glucose 4-epimerase